MAHPQIPALPASRIRIPDVFRSRTSDRLAAMAELFSRNHLFKGCTRDQLGYLAATAYPMSFEAGDLLCIEGTYAPVCYVVAEGHAEVSIGSEPVGTVDPDDVVGERGILLETSRAATVIATSRMITCAIPRERLQTLLEDSRALRTSMLEDVRQHYAGTPRAVAFGNS